MWDAGQHQGTELLRAGQRDCNLVPGEIPHVVVMGELQVGLPPQPLWSILQQRGARQQTGARLTTFFLVHTETKLIVVEIWLLC